MPTENEETLTLKDKHKVFGSMAFRLFLVPLPGRQKRKKSDKKSKHRARAAFFFRSSGRGRPGRVAKLPHYPLLFAFCYNNRRYSLCYNSRPAHRTGRTLHSAPKDKRLPVGTTLLLLLLLLGVTRASIPTGLLLVVLYRGDWTSAPTKVRALHIVHVRDTCIGKKPNKFSVY